MVGTSTATSVAACRIQRCCNSRQRNDLGCQGRHRVTPTRRRFGGQLDNELAPSARPKRSVAPSCSTTLKATRNIYVPLPLLTNLRICLLGALANEPHISSGRTGKQAHGLQPLNFVEHPVCLLNQHAARDFSREMKPRETREERFTTPPSPARASS